MFGLNWTELIFDSYTCIISSLYDAVSQVNRTSAVSFTNQRRVFTASLEESLSQRKCQNAVNAFFYW